MRRRFLQWRCGADHRSPEFEPDDREGALYEWLRERGYTCNARVPAPASGGTPRQCGLPMIEMVIEEP